MDKQLQLATDNGKPRNEIISMCGRFPTICNPLRTPTSADFLRARTLTMTIHNELIDQKQMSFKSYYLGVDGSTYLLRCQRNKINHTVSEFNIQDH